MIKIRTAKKGEVGELQNLNDEVFIDNQKYDSDLFMGWAKSDKGKGYFTNLVNNLNALCLIATDNKVSIGYIAAAPKNFGHRKSKYLEIENMGVIPQYRSKGIGSLLIKKCLKWAKKKGFDKVYVNSYFANSKAIGFYKKSGFSEIDVSLERKV